LSIFVKSSRVKSKMPLYGREPSGSKEAVWKDPPTTGMLSSVCLLVSKCG
jgi:hypothetical protein